MSGDLSRPDVGRIAVVVPAFDEELLLREAIDAIHEAARHVDVPVELVVVANGCRDRTAEVAADRGAHVVVEPVGNVGAARAIGAAWATRAGVDGLWLATTDADSVVPTHWLSTQLQRAREGFDVVLGTVALTPDDEAANQSWADRYRQRPHHVHGANLGVRAAAYRAAGGFRPLAAHEDVDLVERLQAAGAPVAWETAAVVVTSARRDHRAPEGVGADLAENMPA